jgi:hypothetical protein
MTKLTKNFLLRVVGERIDGNGFTLQSSTWVRSSDQVKLGVNVQKSMYSNQHFINFYAWYAIPNGYPFISFPKGTFHLMSRGPIEHSDIRDRQLMIDGREVDVSTYSKELGNLWFDKAFHRLLQYQNLENLKLFVSQHLDDQGFTILHQLKVHLDNHFVN